MCALDQPVPMEQVLAKSTLGRRVEDRDEPHALGVGLSVLCEHGQPGPIRPHDLGETGEVFRRHPFGRLGRANDRIERKPPQLVDAQARPRREDRIRVDQPSAGIEPRESRGKRVARHSVHGSLPFRGRADSR